MYDAVMLYDFSLRKQMQRNAAFPFSRQIYASTAYFTVSYIFLDRLVLQRLLWPWASEGKSVHITIHLKKCELGTKYYRSSFKTDEKKVEEETGIIASS